MGVNAAILHVLTWRQRWALYEALALRVLPEAWRLEEPDLCVAWDWIHTTGILQREPCPATRWSGSSTVDPCQGRDEKKRVLPLLREMIQQTWEQDARAVAKPDYLCNELVQRCVRQVSNVVLWHESIALLDRLAGAENRTQQPTDARRAYAHLCLVLTLFLNPQTEPFDALFWYRIYCGLIKPGCVDEVGEVGGLQLSFDLNCLWWWDQVLERLGDHTR